MEMLHQFCQRLLQIVFFSLGIYVLLLLLINGEYLTELPGTKCTDIYQVSHDRERPDWNLYGINLKPDNNTTPEKCQDWCNKDVNCRSVTYRIQRLGRRDCMKFDISVQELKDTDGKIHTETDRINYPTYITYDRDCACPPGYEPNDDNTYPCQTCNNNYYKPNISNDNCQECPQERPHTAMIRSISKENCTNLFCPPGKYLAESKTCVECPLHTYKEHNDTSKCLNCSSEIPHTIKTGTINNDACTNLFCPAGIGLYGKVCISCKVNEVSSNGTGPCIQPREGEEPNHNQSKFICSAGYGRIKLVDRCQKCQPGYFKSESGDRQCHLCPPNSLPILGAITCEVDRGIQVEVVIGVLLGSVVVLAAAGFAVVLYCRKHRKRPKQSPETSSEEGEAKGNDFSDDYSGESGSSNSLTVALSTSLSDTTVTTYSCTPTFDSKSTKIVSSTFSWKPRERNVAVARNELFTEKGKENYVKDDKNDWDEDENMHEGRNVDEDGDEDEDKNENVDEDGDGFVDEYDDGFLDDDEDGFVDDDDDGFGDEDRDGNADEDRDGNVDEGKDEYEY